MDDKSRLELATELATDLAKLLFFDKINDKTSFARYPPDTKTVRFSYLDRYGDQKEGTIPLSKYILSVRIGYSAEANTVCFDEIVLSTTPPEF